MSGQVSRGSAGEFRHDLFLVLVIYLFYFNFWLLAQAHFIFVSTIDNMITRPQVIQIINLKLSSMSVFLHSLTTIEFMTPFECLYTFYLLSVLVALISFYLA